MKSLALFICLIACTAHAGGEKFAPKPMRIAMNDSFSKRPRSLSSLQSETTVRFRNFKVSLRVLVGGTISNGISDASSMNPSAGVDMEWQLLKNVGLEGSFFYLPSYNNTQTLINPITGDSINVNLSEKSTDLLAIAKYQFVFNTGSVRWLPRLGLGYGSFTSNSSGTGYPAPISSEVSSSSSISGLYGFLGTEAVLNGLYGLRLDYTFGLNTNDSSDIKVASSRLRAAISYRVTPAFHVGAEYSMRAFRSDGSNDGIEQTRYLGFVQLKM